MRKDIPKEFSKEMTVIMGDCVPKIIQAAAAATVDYKIVEERAAAFQACMESFIASLTMSLAGTLHRRASKRDTTDMDFLREVTCGLLRNAITGTETAGVSEIVATEY